MAEAKLKRGRPRRKPPTPLYVEVPAGAKLTRDGFVIEPDPHRWPRRTLLVVWDEDAQE